MRVEGDTFYFILFYGYIGIRKVGKREIEKRLPERREVLKKTTTPGDEFGGGGGCWG